MDYLSDWRSVKNGVDGGYEGRVRTGARMNTPVKGIFESRSPSISSGASNDSTYNHPHMNSSLLTHNPNSNSKKTPTCDPHPFLATDTLIPPSTSCPPFFGFETCSARRIAPAQVPHTVFVWTKVLRGVRRLESLARRAMVVDSAGCHCDYESGIRSGRGWELALGWSRAGGRGSREMRTSARDDERIAKS